MSNLLIGMYVRCPLDHETEEDSRLFIIGQIEEINMDTQEAIVVFHDILNLRQYYDFIPSEKIFPITMLNRCKILINTSVVLRKDRTIGKVVHFIKKDNDLNYYYVVETKKENENHYSEICENQLLTSFNRGDFLPTFQIMNYEFHNPFWYKKRTTVMRSLHTLRNATYGFETLVGSRVLLLPHQVDTIIRAISVPTCRFMLADEVGLGKTVEAIVIMKGLKQRLGEVRTLIIAPESLIYQWKNELSYKFWLDVPVWSKGIDSTNGDLIFPMEKINTPLGKQILKENWSLCIVDETHRLIDLENEYQIISVLSSKIDHLLLLSATPIQQRRTEFLKLLSLLVPSRYGQLQEKEFDVLLEKQDFLREKVHRLVKYLPDYNEDNLVDDYIDDFNDIGVKLKDEIFNQLISRINRDSNDKGLTNVKFALAYLGEYYQIERHILRHRRLELKDKMPRRKHILVSYEMVGADYNYYEHDTYEMLIEYLVNIRTGNMNSLIIGEYIKIFLSAMLSSPFALLSLLLLRLDIVKGHIDEYEGETELFSHHFEAKKEEIILKINVTSEEESLLEDLIKVAGLWKDAVINEFDRFDELNENPDLINGRLMKVLDYLSETVSPAKYVIFSTWTETVKALEQLLQKKFGKESVVSFYQGKSDEQLQEAVDLFQSDINCRFLISDELGGEGRNFQMAEEILHVDLPWSPVRLEQRIGRLDRIGRNNDVISVVFCAEQTLDESLFRLWNEGLNIFNESLSGLEIALGEIHDQIITALGTDIKYGLNEVLEHITQQSKNMRDLVEKERYFDMARHLDTHIENQLNRLIEQFDANNGQNLSDTMLSWAESTGLYSQGSQTTQIISFNSKMSISSMHNTLFTPPDMTKIWKRSKKEQTILGTFSRRDALQREDLAFFAPGDPFFDAIVNNADESARGRCCAFAFPTNLQSDWKGFIFTWSICINPGPLLKLGFDLQNLTYAQGYVPLEPIITFEPISEEYSVIDEKMLRANYNKFLTDSKVVHLGKRNIDTDFLNINRDYRMSNSQWFRREYPVDMWRESSKQAFFNSKSKIEKESIPKIELNLASEEFQKRLNGIEASNIYFNNGEMITNQSSKNEQRIFDAILEGLKSPVIKLESIAFSWMVSGYE